MRRLIMVLLCLMLLGSAAADTLVLPADTTSVADRAFIDTAVTEVVLPAGLALDHIGVDAFPPGTLVKGPQEGLEDWAWANGYEYDNDCTRRALIIGQTYVGAYGFSNKELPACANDANGFAAMLQMNMAYPYEITVARNMTKAGILNAIRTAFAGAGPNDVSLFYYSGHGETNTGALCPIDLFRNSVTISMHELRQALDQVPGTKIIILDSCYSGNMVLEAGGEMTARSAGPLTVDQLNSLNSRIISAFATDWTARSGGYPEYIVITASRADEQSWADRQSSYFTYYMCVGSGYNIDRCEPTSGAMPADANGDLDITQREILLYTRQKIPGTTQTSQAYPTGGCSFVLWGAP